MVWDSSHGSSKQTVCSGRKCTFQVAPPSVLSLLFSSTEAAFDLGFEAPLSTSLDRRRHLDRHEDGEERRSRLQWRPRSNGTVGACRSVRSVHASTEVCIDAEVWHGS